MPSKKKNTTKRKNSMGNNKVIPENEVSVVRPSYGRRTLKQLEDEKFNQLTESLSVDGQLVVRLGLAVEEALQVVKNIRQRARTIVIEEASAQLGESLSKVREKKVEKVLQLPVEEDAN